MSARALSLTIGKMQVIYICWRAKKTTFEPSLSVLSDIIEVCGSTPEEFFYHDINAYKQDKQALEFFKTLSSNQKNAIMNLYTK